MSLHTSLPELQTAFISRLSGDSTLMAIATGVFDYGSVPTNQAYPYITVGDSTEGPMNAFGTRGYLSSLTLHIWDNRPGFARCYQILARMNDLLDQQIVGLATLKHVYTLYDFSQTLNDPGLDDVRHMPVRYLTFAQEVAGVTTQDVNLLQILGAAISGSNPLPTSLSTLPPGTNVIGHVIIDSAGSVSITSLPSLPAGSNVIGHVIIDSASNVAITSLPSLPAGTNNIGTLAPFVDISASGSVTTDLDVVSIALPGGQTTALVQITTSNLNGTLLFEASPDSGTTYYAVQGVQIGSNTIATSVAGTGGNQAAGVWRFNVAGFTNFHVKLHPVTGGTATVKIILTQGVQDVAVRNATTLGQNTKANSTSVTIASDQSSVASPLTTAPQTEAACESAQAFIATTGTKTATVAANQALSVFNPGASGKTLRVKRITGVYGVTANAHPDLQLTYQTTDPAFTSAVTPQNMSLGGAASVASVTQTAVNTGASIAGTMLMEQDTSSDNATELLAQGFFYKVPPGTGITLYFNAANTSTYAMNMQWIEY